MDTLTKEVYFVNLYSLRYKFFLFIIAFFSGRLLVHYPVVALLIIAEAVSLVYLFPVVLFLLLGTLTYSFDLFLINLTLVIAYFLISQALKFNIKRAVIKNIIIAFLLTFCNTFYQYFINKNQFNYEELTLSLIATIVVSLFATVIAVDINVKKMRLISTEGIIFLFTFFICSLLAMPTFHWTFSIKTIVAIYLLFIFMRSVEHPMTIVTICLIAYLTTSTWESFFIVLTTFSTLTITAKYYKLISISLFVLTNTFLSYYLKNSNLFIEFMIASSLLLITPISLIKKWLFSTGTEIVKSMYVSENQFISKIQNFSSLLEKIAAQFVITTKEEKIQTASNLLYKNICNYCSKKQLCYQSNVSDLIEFFKKGTYAINDKKEIEYIKNNCRQSDKYLELLDVTKRNFKNDNDRQRFLSHQFSTISNVLKKTSQQIQFKNMKVNENIEKELGEKLQKHKMNLLFLYKNFAANGEMLIEAIIKARTATNIMQVGLNIFNDICNCNFDLEAIEQYSKVDHYYIKLKKTTKFTLTYGVAQISKDPLFCGDSYDIINYDSSVALVLSDGMGYGKNAQKESKFVTSILRESLLASIEMATAIKSINTVLKLKNSYETYATLDIIDFNKYNGRANFYKTGAHCSFLMRNGKIFKINGRDLPLGIIDEVPINNFDIMLMEGDILIMLSDGFDSLTDKFIKEQIIMLSSYPAQTIASSFINQIKKMKAIDDDASIIAIKVSAF